MLVIADTSPLNYLILIDAVGLLPRLYRKVILPQSAWEEMKHPGAPLAVSRWAHDLPVWIELRSAPDFHFDPGLAALGKGESEAITLAEKYRHDSEVLLLLDEELARRHAAVRHLKVTGTLGILKSAASQGWIDLALPLARLRQTNFRISTKFLNEMLLPDHPDAPAA